MVNITEEDIDILIIQTNIPREQAKQILIANNGDLVDTIIKIQNNEIDLENIEQYEKDKRKYDENNDISNSFDVDVTNKDELKKYREIVDSKDEIYAEIKKKKEEKEKKALENSGKSENNTTDFSAEELYYIKKKTSKFNSIRVL